MNRNFADQILSTHGVWVQAICLVCVKCTFILLHLKVKVTVYEQSLQCILVPDFGVLVHACSPVFLLHSIYEMEDFKILNL